MIIDLNEEEKKKLDEYDKMYAKLIKEAYDKVVELRPIDSFKPNEEELNKIDSIDVHEPPMPEPIRISETTGRPVYSKEELEEWEQSPEYKVYLEESEKRQSLLDDLYDKWEKAGSPEWKEALEKYYNLKWDRGMRANIIIEMAETRHMNEIGEDPAAILEDAREQANKIIERRYFFYEKKRTENNFLARDVRIFDDSTFKLDYMEMKRVILHQLENHIEKLKDKTQIEKVVDRALTTNPLVIDNGGVLGGWVKMKQTEPETQKGLTARHPKQYKRPTTKVHSLLFDNEILTETNHFTPVALDKKKEVLDYVNFAPNADLKVKGMDYYVERVYSGAWSCKLAGNSFIPFSMLYNRGILCLPPKEENRKYSFQAVKDMKDALDRLRGVATITNDPTHIHENDTDFDYKLIQEPLLFFQYNEERVHGELIQGIAIPDSYVPVAFRYAEDNGNEIKTLKIDKVYVSGLIYSRDNIIIANSTYRALLKIMYDNDKKRYKKEMPENKRTIRYDYIYGKVAQAHTLSDMKPQREYKDLTRTERSRFKSKIDLCMKSYQMSGLFSRYEHIKDNSKSFYAVLLYFNDEPAKITVVK